jgi:hypothetical protein
VSVLVISTHEMLDADDEPDEADEPPSTWLTCVMVVCSTPKDFSMLIIAET